MSIKQKYMIKMSYNELKHLACHSLEQESIHRESHGIVFVWDESGMTFLAFNHTPLSE